MLKIFLLILPSFLLIIAGGLLKISKIADDRWVDVLNSYGLWVGFPSLIFETILRLDISDVINKWQIILFNSVFLIFLILTAVIVGKLLKLRTDIMNTYTICIFFGNVAYLGYPVIMSIFPARESELSIIMSLYVIVLFTVGVGWLEYSETRKVDATGLILKFLKNPFIVSIGLGILFLILRLSVPDFIKKALIMLKGSASPVVLVALGIFIFRKLSILKIARNVVLLSFIKLIAVPLLMYAIAWSIGLKSKLEVSIIESAMPLAITPFALSSLYKLDRELIGASIVFSTLMSMFTLTMFIYLLY